MGLKSAHAQRRRGRKLASESRAAEIRARLLGWKRMPETQRMSLRKLAAELGTSHQLLCCYLRGLDEWHRKEQSNEWERLAQEISDRAATEQRPLKPWEQTRITAYRRSLRILLDSVINRAAERVTREMQKALKDGNVTEALNLAKLLSRMGSAEAQQLLQMHSKRHG
jgi:hypothetical protein